VLRSGRANNQRVDLAVVLQTIIKVTEFEIYESNSLLINNCLPKHEF
jgi:hypothetical protein